MALVQGHYVADENGSNEPLRRYSQKTLVIVLPGDLTVFDIGEYQTLNQNITFEKSNVWIQKVQPKHQQFDWKVNDWM